MIQPFFLASIALRFAQIVPDATLPQNTIVVPSGDTIVIEGGTTIGTNLFHSFREFSVPTETEAFFNNAIEIENILTRVTGDDISTIDGLLQTNGTANLFLLNPNGIVFGPNANLDIGGSFAAGAGDAIAFADGFEFGAVPATTPLLTVSVPVGLQIGATQGNIVVGGELAVPSQQGLQLTGRNVSVDRGTLLAPYGSIDVRALERIDLSHEAIVDASGEGAGRISLSADSIFLSGGSSIQSTTLGASRGREISINTNHLSITDNAFIAASVLGSGNGADINISSNNIELVGNGQFDLFFRFFTNTITPDSLANGVFLFVFSDGAGGDFTIDTERISLTNGAGIGLNTSGTGVTGNFFLSASELFVGNSAGLGITTNSSSPLGTTGDIFIDADKIIILNGGAIANATASPARAGNLIVRARDIQLDGISADGNILSTINAQTLSSGDAGNVSIFTDRLTLSNGAQLTVATNGTGRAGDLTVIASQVVIEGQAPGTPIFIATSIASESGTENIPLLPQGDFLAPAGDVLVRAENIIIRDGARIVAGSTNNGDAGSILVESQNLVLDGGNIVASTRSGERGNIEIDSNWITVTNGGSIAASSFSNQGGDIEINSDILLIDNSSIIASTVEGNGGNITINTQGFFDRAAIIDASSNLGLSGTIEIDRGQEPTLDRPDLPANFIDYDVERFCENIETAELDVATNEPDFVEATGFYGNGSEVILTAEATAIPDDRILKQQIDWLLDSPTQENLNRIVNLIEVLRLKELGEFLPDVCSRVRNAYEIDASAAVFHTLVLDDRLLAIVRLSSGEYLWHQTTVPNLSDELDRIQRNLGNPTYPFPEQQSKQLYDALIAPFEARLQGVDTLVFVLDARLQRIPMAALSDGDSYLVEKFAIALIPALQLIERDNAARTNSIVAGGISAPQPGWSSLPFVADELNEVDSRSVLTNSELKIDALKNEIERLRPAIVHLATHGLFGSTPQDTIIALWEENITLEQLPTILENPLDLLVLTACEAATGDDRALLGLAGVAVRSGASSTLASIWTVPDSDSTVQFVREFYRHLELGETKAEALRQAQLSVLYGGNPDWHYPQYWAPFVLVGDWGSW